MLVSTSRRHLPTTTTFPPSPQQDTLQNFHNTQKLALNSYLESQQHHFGSFPDASLEPFMSGSYDFSNPAIRIQHSTPTPQQQQGAFPQTPMLSNANNTGLEAWNSYSQSLQTPTRGHQRASSASSTASSTSPYTVASNPYQQQTFLNNLPTPTQTPTQESFLTASNLNNFTPTSSAMDQNMVAHMSMKQALMDQSDDVHDLPDFAHSARQSVSSYGHDSPATPRTQIGDDMNDTRQHPAVPKLDRTYTDIAADNFYDPRTTAPVVPQTRPAQSSLLSPYRGNMDGVQQAIQAANLARSQSQQTHSQSPSSTVSRDNSPFRRESPYMSAQLRWGGEKERPQTISPKEAFLPYQESEDSKGSLFPDSGASDFDAQYTNTGGEQYRNATQTGFNTASVQPVRRDGWATSAMQAVPSLPQTTSFNFATPAVQPSMHSLNLGATSQYRPTSNVTAPIEQTPEFPAHLTSMESSASEAEPPSGSQNSDVFLHKPASSRADSGTYSCTYHGCVQRFETPQKLQKHKRDDHRNINTAMTSAALLERNSQAGPHKCERINPTTGKPCNTIFSRPYDLTRHEDTIHNARKQKVRCALCVEEKTFSRNDALTRHMRVVHPEIEFPGKHRKRGDHQD